MAPSRCLGVAAGTPSWTVHHGCMAEFRIVQDVAAPAGSVFDRLVDWDAHSAAIPLTRLHHDGVAVVGQRFVARTRVGRIGFDDPMELQLLRRPAGDRPGEVEGVVEVAKTGRVVTGRVRWTVTPTETGARVEWVQQLTVGWLPRFLDPVVGVVSRAAYGAGLAGLLGPLRSNT